MSGPKGTSRLQDVGTFASNGKKQLTPEILIFLTFEQAEMLTYISNKNKLPLVASEAIHFYFINKLSKDFISSDIALISNSEYSFEKSIPIALSYKKVSALDLSEFNEVRNQFDNNNTLLGKYFKERQKLGNEMLKPGRSLEYQEDIPIARYSEETQT